MPQKRENQLLGASVLGERTNKLAQKIVVLVLVEGLMGDGSLFVYGGEPAFFRQGPFPLAVTR